MSEPEIREQVVDNPPETSSLRATDADFSTLAALMEKQLAVLHRMDQRFESADFSRQPVPDAPLTSNSVWNPLYKSLLTEKVQPKIDRWRSGLDALLVFLGLFSAIVTAFFVDSLHSLKPDESVRTNELLTNLTAILVAMNSGQPVNLPLTSSTPFSPDPIDVRLNSFWSLSLILSLCVAALAVACRSFLGMLTHSKHMKPADSCLDLWAKWNAAERLLSPIVDALPPLLIFPVVLFLAGLVDLLLSNILQISPLPRAILATSGIGLLSIVGILTFLSITLVHACVYPGTSPFSSSISIFLHKWLVKHFKASFYHISSWITGSITSTDQQDAQDTEVGQHKLCVTYHEVIPTISDDDTLDAASAALHQVITSQLSTWRFILGDDATLLNSEQCNTILYLLSPEARLRSNLTAAGIIVQIYKTLPANFGYYNIPRGTLCPSELIEILLSTLADAAQRSVGNLSLSTLWNSPFLEAMSIVTGSSFTSMTVKLADKEVPAPPVIAILASEHWAWKYLSLSSLPRGHGVLKFYIDVVSAKARAGGWPGQLDANQVQCILASFLHVIQKTATSDDDSFIRFMIEASSVPAVIHAAITNMDSISNQQLQGFNSEQQYNLDYFSRCIHYTCVHAEYDRLLADFWLKYLLQILPYWQPSKSWHWIPGFSLWLRDTLYPIISPSELYNKLSHLCTVMEHSPHNDPELLSVVKDLLTQAHSGEAPEGNSPKDHDAIMEGDNVNVIETLAIHEHPAEIAVVPAVVTAGSSVHTIPLPIDNGEDDAEHISLRSLRDPYHAAELGGASK